VIAAANIGHSPRVYDEQYTKPFLATSSDWA